VGYKFYETLLSEINSGKEEEEDEENQTTLEQGDENK